MRTKVVAIDGPGGAGKSTLAQRVSVALGDAPIVHTDDFASWDTPLEWWPRPLDQVLRPGPYVVLEGVSASREAFRPYLTLAVWVRTGRAERLRRGLARDGQAARGQWLECMAQEDAYLRRERPDRSADLVVSGEDG